MARLTSPQGASVDVADEKVEGLLGRGFTQPEAPKKAAAKKASSSKSSTSEK